MSDKIDQILENQVRIETKIDVLMMMLKAFSAFMGNPIDMKASPWGPLPFKCPVCEGLVKFRINAASGGVERTCGCGTGLVPTKSPEEIMRALDEQQIAERKNDGSQEDDAAERVLDELEARETPSIGPSGRGSGPV